MVRHKRSRTLRPSAKRAASNVAVAGPPLAARRWADVWKPFAREYKSWVTRTNPDGPIYALPDAARGALHGLKHPNAKGTHSFDGNVEKEFFDLCAKYSLDTVGVWKGKPIVYPLLAKPSLAISVPAHLQAEWAAADSLPEGGLVESLETASTRLLAIHHQQLGLVGQFTFNEQYRDDRRALMELWDRANQPLPLDVGSRSLLGPAIPVPSISGKERMPKSGATFYDELARFLLKWRLRGFATWDLPLPQGPLEGTPAAIITNLRGPDSLVDHVPAPYDIPSSQDLREKVRGRQHDEGQLAGIELEFPVTNTSARKNTPSQYETAFRMWLIEETIRRRYHVLPGAVSRLQAAFAGMFNISATRARQLRTLYSQILTA